jgi:hypothetical protein
MSSKNVVVDPQQRHLEYGRRADRILLCGILSVVLSATFFCAVVGLIMAIVNLISANKFIAETGPLFLKARIGKYLSVGGIVLGSILGCYSVLFYVALVASIIQNIK